MIAAIVQARLSSTRLPGKVLKKILGKPLLELQIERLRRVESIDNLIVATSNEPSDDDLPPVCENLDIPCFRGSLDDVLDRFYRAARSVEANHVVRLTADCPLTDPGVIDRIIQFYLKDEFDYASNTIEPTFPDGLDAEVFSFDTLERVWSEAKLPSQREHVTPYLYNNPSIFKLGSYKEEPDYSHMRWTVDEPADFEFVKKVYETLYPVNSEFVMNDVISLLKSRPALGRINQGLERNAGSADAQKRDIEYLEGMEAKV